MKILVTGGTGLVGTAIKKYLSNAVFVNSSDYDLTDPRQVQQMFYEISPTHVIHLASMVGGVEANNKYPVEFFEQNILINTNVLKYAHAYNVDRLVSCMSTCIFPNDVNYPITVDQIHNGEPHETNFGYAYAKRMLEVQTRAYQKQYNKKWFTVIPTNVYGPFDNFNPERSHVIPALIKKCYDAKQNNEPFVVWGSGNAYREFIYSFDLANALVYVLFNYDSPEPIIISNPNQVTIKEVANIIANKMQFTGDIIFDSTKLEGQLRKPTDTASLLNIYKEMTYTPLEDGIYQTIKWYESTL